MLQRIQSLYLILTILLYCIAIYMVPIFKHDGDSIYFISALSSSNIIILSIPFFIIISIIISGVTLTFFHNRKRQMFLSKFNIVLNLILLGIFVFHLLTLPGETSFSEKGIWYVFPFIFILLQYLAYSNINKDEALVKSVDRIR